ncbi:MAG: hypothetical protein DDT37_00294 [Firmicutes bacterium]|nr:hypothetical protein [candidate division NPL-UPA2 bacterium]
MIRVSNIKVPLAERGEVLPCLLKKLGIANSAVSHLHIYKEAIDARRKDNIRFVYTVDVAVDDEAKLLQKSRDPDIAPAPTESYCLPKLGEQSLKYRPVIIGTGPAGLFAGLLLSELGFRPLLLERGDDVDRRAAKVRHFWLQGDLDPNSNVQFGEGGAGTFSDGKLTTNIKDPRCRKVLSDLVAAGAPENILFSSKPHVGTDILRSVVRAIRQTIMARGGEVRFRAQATDFCIDRGAVSGVVINAQEVVPADVVIMAPGHSARDTFAALLARGVDMAPKPFAIGARIEHPQALIDEAQYGRAAGHPNLGAADYKLSHHPSSGRSVYTFCMCPGGQVVAAASEQCGVVTNGMSEHARASGQANSAVLVEVCPADYGSTHPLAGALFQRHWEERAWQLGGQTHRAPAQLVGDFLSGRRSAILGGSQFSYLPGVEPSDLSLCLPGFVIASLQAGLLAFDRQLKGFANPRAVLTGVETRSSSPVKMVRGEDGQSSIRGLYVAGGGAGYAGGIMSAAVDGLRVAEAVARKYRT